KVKPPHQVTDDAQPVEHHQAGDRLALRPGAEAGEDQDAAVEPRSRDREELHPQPYEREVEDQEHQVPDVEARDQTPDEIGISLEELRSRVEVVALERREE